MKANKVRKTGPWALLAGLGLVVVVATVIGIIAGYEKLHAIWVEQCVITDMERQVAIDSGKMVKADVIAGVFGLKPGANLALIDFAAKREAALAKIPNLREIRICEIGTIIASHCGSGTVAVFFLGDERAPYTQK